MALRETVQSNLDPQGWNLPNKYDDLLLRYHPLEWKPRKKDDKLRLSWSLLKSGLHCARAATWEVFPERFGIPEDALKFTDSLASIRGNLVQTLLEHTYAHEFLKLPPEDLILALQASWRWGVSFYKPLNTVSPKELLSLRVEIFSTLPKIFDTMNTHGLWASHQEVEKALWWDMHSLPGVRLTGKADFVLCDPGNMTLIDGKWVGNPSYLDARQLGFYALILSKMTGKIPQRALFWLYPQGRILDFSADVLTPAFFQLVLQDASKVATQIRSLDDTPHASSYNCKWCKHRDICPDAVRK